MIGVYQCYMCIQFLCLENGRKLLKDELLLASGSLRAIASFHTHLYKTGAQNQHMTSGAYQFHTHMVYIIYGRMQLIYHYFVRKVLQEND